MNVRVLLVEDEPLNRDLTARGLRRAGFQVTAVGEGRAALRAAETTDFALIVLDLILPDVDGIDVCRELRARTEVPILMLTGRANTTDVVVGLEIGADDYLTKPFQMPELVARVRALLRRSGRKNEDSVIRLNGLEIDPWTYRVSKENNEIDLTTIEFKLLMELARHPGRVVSQEALINRVWDTDYLGDPGLIYMAVKRLREKLEDDPSDPQLIRTIRGIGYRLEVNLEPSRH